MKKNKDINECLSAASPETTHKISFDDAYWYIDSFQRIFSNLPFYGGTIWINNIDDFNPNPNTNKVLKFHYCAVSTNPEAKVFVAFELDNCSANIAVSGNCYIACDSSFGKIPRRWGSPSALLLEYLTISQNQGCNQIMPPTDVQNARENFAWIDGPYRSHLGSILNKGFTGYFNFDNSIRDIFSEAPISNPCKGIRYFFGYKAVDQNQRQVINRIRVILVGVDQYGTNLKTWRETSIPFEKKK